MVNKVILLGHVGKDPEIRHMDNNLVMARFSLATTERWNSKEGNRLEHTEWHNIVMWRSLAEVAEKYIRKGSLLFIEGKIRYRNYEDKDGNKRFSVDVVADAMHILGSKSDGGSTQQSTLSLQEPPPESLIDSAPPDNMTF